MEVFNRIEILKHIEKNSPIRLADFNNFLGHKNGEYWGFLLNDFYSNGYIKYDVVKDRKKDIEITKLGKEKLLEVQENEKLIMKLKQTQLSVLQQQLEDYNKFKWASIIISGVAVVISIISLIIK